MLAFASVNQGVSMQMSLITSLALACLISLNANATSAVLATCTGKSIDKLTVVVWGGGTGCGSQIRIWDGAGIETYDGGMCEPDNQNEFTFSAFSQRLNIPGVVGKGVMVAVDLVKGQGAVARHGLIEVCDAAPVKLATICKRLWAIAASTQQTFTISNRNLILIPHQNHRGKIAVRSIQCAA